METYTVKLNCEFVESVQANNKTEAEQLAIRLLNLSLGSSVHCVATTEIKVSNKPNQEKQDGNEKS